MELPQPRPFGAEGRRTTHDFLSLYSPAQQDLRPPQGAYLKTHDFLQPLEQGGKTAAKEENKFEITAAEKPPPPAPPPSVEHALPGGIGTYTISYFNQRAAKPEGTLFTMAQASSTDINDENSNCSSYSGFTLLDESVIKKGKTGKENISGDKRVLREAGVNMGGGHWMTSTERPSQSSANHKHNTTNFGCHSSSQTSSAQKSQSFLHVITSAKSPQEEDECEDEDFDIKKEPSLHPKGNLSVKVDGRNSDPKPNTPRSKHSATEQRRRSKINDRIQMLREIIPHSDQKRDKASFLLEVIEYIHYLQEKVHKYEGSYQGWNHETSKLMAWQRKCHGTAESFDPIQGINASSSPALVFGAKFDESNVVVSPSIHINGQNIIEPNTKAATTNCKDTGPQLQLTNKAAHPCPPVQHSKFPFGGNVNVITPLSPRLASDTNNMASQPQSQFWQRRPCTVDSTVPSDKLKDELKIESGTISISSVYSQRLLDMLTQALQSSGIDLSQANISVQIDLGKRASSTLNSSASNIKGDDVSTSNKAMPRSVVTSTGDDSDQALKRLKTSRS